MVGSSKPPLTDKTNVPSNSISITYLTETIDSGSENCTEGYVTDLRFDLISDDHVAIETHSLPTKCVFVLIGFLEVQDIVLDMTPHNRYPPITTPINLIKLYHFKINTEGLHPHGVVTASITL